MDGIIPWWVSRQTGPRRRPGVIWPLPGHGDSTGLARSGRAKVPGRVADVDITNIRPRRSLELRQPGRSCAPDRPRRLEGTHDAPRRAGRFRASGSPRHDPAPSPGRLECPGFRVRRAGRARVAGRWAQRREPDPHRGAVGGRRVASRCPASAGGRRDVRYSRRGRSRTRRAAAWRRGGPSTAADRVRP
jgi:hypothetical protein